MNKQTTNRVWCFDKFGGPEVLYLETQPIPEPKDHEVLINVQSFGLNRSDMLWMGAAFFTPELPARVGSEICGVIEKVGKNVKHWKAGDRVSNFVKFYIGDYGSYANYAVLPADCLMPTPAHMPASHGAAIAIYFTAYMGLQELVQLRPYQSVVITAASSAAGLASVSLAKKIGADVIAVTRSNAKRDLLLKAGANHVIATDEQELVAGVHNLTNGEGADVIFDCVAGSQMLSLMQCVKLQGNIISYGVLDETPVTIPWYTGFARLPQINFFSLLQFTGNPSTDTPPQEDAIARAKHFITEGVKDGSLPAHIAREFEGIESLPDAFRFMASNSGGGKIIVTL